MSTTSRQLPRSVESIWKAISMAKNKKDSTPPANNVFRAATALKLDDAFIDFGQARQARVDAKVAYTGNTPIKNAAISRLRMFNSQFIQHLNDAIDRGDITPNSRGHYHIDENDGAVPSMVKEQDVMTWAKNIIDGEAARLALGGTALMQPSAADISALRGDAQLKLNTQSTLYEAYNAAQEELKMLMGYADVLVREMWAEIESAFAGDLDAGSRRTKAEQWGVVYVTIGAKKNKIQVTVLDSVTNEPIENAIVDFNLAGLEMTTASNGVAVGFEDFVGEDTLTISHLDYVTQVIPVTLLEDEGFNITVLLVAV